MGAIGKWKMSMVLKFIYPVFHLSEFVFYETRILDEMNNFGHIAGRRKK